MLQQYPKISHGHSASTAFHHTNQSMRNNTTAPA